MAHAVTTPRVLGPYAVAWHTTEFRDAVLGRLGGVFRGTVMQYQADRGFFVADAFWLPPDGDPIGPMAFTVACAPAGGNTSPGTEVRVTQQGYEDSERWRRYYEVIELGWSRIELFGIAPDAPKTHLGTWGLIVTQVLLLRGGRIEAISEERGILWTRAGTELLWPRFRSEINACVLWWECPEFVQSNES